MLSKKIKALRIIPGGGILLRILFSCDIGSGAKIADNVEFYHRAHGVVISSSATIEENCRIQHHVTIGVNKSKTDAPVIHRNVFIGAYAMILGAVDIGENAIIGAGTLVMHDVPANARVISNQKMVFI